MPPPPEVSARAHAGCLSFEFSAGAERLIVNCAASLVKGPEWTQAMRATAAHSTMIVADTSSAHIVAGAWPLRLLGPQLIEGPTQVHSKRNETEDGVLLELAHDGYQKPFALTHERRLFLSHDGADLRGEDRLLSRDGQAPVRRFALRFHLHPSLKVAQEDGRSVLLTLPSGVSWRLRVDADLDVVDSVYLGGDAIRKTSQIVLSGFTGSESTVIKWALKKVAKTLAFEPTVN